MGKCQYCGQWAGLFKDCHDECYAKCAAPKTAIQTVVREEVAPIVRVTIHEPAHDERLRLEKAQGKYREAFDRHMKMLEKIEQLYSVAINLYAVDGPEMQHVEGLCKEDIRFLREYKTADDEQRDAWIAYYIALDGKARKYPYPPIEYWDSYKRLAIIYEKQKRWQEAIDVCESAIAHGITKDGNKSGFIGRAARLTRKMRDAATEKLEGPKE